MYWTEYLIIVRTVASSPLKTEKQPENLSVKTAKNELERTSKMILDIIKILRKCLSFAEIKYGWISEEDKKITYHSRKLLLFENENTWMKKRRDLFDVVTMGPMMVWMYARCMMYLDLIWIKDQRNLW